MFERVVERLFTYTVNLCCRQWMQRTRLPQYGHLERRAMHILQIFSSLCEERCKLRCVHRCSQIKQKLSTLKHGSIRLFQGRNEHRTGRIIVSELRGSSFELQKQPLDGLKEGVVQISCDTFSFT